MENEQALAVPATVDRPWWVLVAGPVVSGTGGDPLKVAANLARLEAQALPLYERGHLAVVGEWLALPIIRAAGGHGPGDEVFERYQYPVARRMVARCDAVLRLPGASVGADQDVAQARALGLPVFERVEDLPFGPSAPSTNAVA